MDNNTKPIKEVMDLSGKSAIVTGGAMGIGAGIAYRLAEAGAAVLIADINEHVSQTTVADLTARGFKADFVVLDVSNKESIDAAVAKAGSSFGGVDILVNNAGIYPTFSLMDIKPGDIDKVVGVNLKGAMMMTQVVARVMQEQGRGGKIINITSVDALHPSSVGLSVYDSTKHGLWGFTKSVALELAPHKIYVNAIAPGGISTPGTGVGGPVDPKLQELIKLFEKKIPMKRMGESDEIGKVALFLASDLSSYMTGSQIVVDGGVLLA